MHRVLLTDSDLIVIYDLEFNDLAHAVLNFLRYNEVEITNEHEMHYYFLQTYNKSRIRPLDEEDAQEIAMQILEGNAKYFLAYHEDKTFAIRPSDELRGVLDY